MASGVQLGQSQEKLDAIQELLVAAGYFRARISALSPFDKVVGGMVWCISAANVDVDVNIMFEEDSNIGQKIKVSESLEKALRRMKCPFPLQAHQIQGLDFPNIFPVVQWLVKKAFEMRQELGDQIRRYSSLLFDRSYTHPTDADFVANRASSQPFVSTVMHSYAPSRKYRRAPEVDAGDDAAAASDARVHSTLLEYGRRYKLSATAEAQKATAAAAAAGSAEGDGTGSRQKKRASGVGAGASGALEESAEERVKKVEVEEQEIAEIMQELSEASEETRVSRAKVGNFVGLQSDMIRRVAQEYNALARQLEEQTSQRKVEDESHRRRVEALQKQVAVAAGRVTALHEAHNEALGSAGNVRTSVEGERARIHHFQEELQSFYEIEKRADPRDLQQLKNLVQLNEMMKVQEREFKGQCKRDLGEWKDRLEKMRAELEAEAAERQKDLETASSSDREKFEKILQLVAQRNREIAMLQRNIEDIPARSELIQYEKRFLELYEQVELKLDETRRYYVMYNTLQETLNFLQQELSIMNSIHEKFEVAMGSKSGRTSFMKQLEDIVNGIEKNKGRVFSKLKDEQSGRAELLKLYNTLLESERKYFKTVKEFQEECKKTEVLQEQLRELNIES